MADAQEKEGKNEIKFRFDRSAEGGGVEALCTLKNGRAFLEWRFHLTAYSENRFERIVFPCDMEEGFFDGQAMEEHIRLRLTDMEDNPVLECIHFLREEEPLQSILPKPEVWRGVSHPYLYQAEAVLEDGEGNSLDRMGIYLPLRQVEYRNRDGKEEILLNGEVLERKMVRYALPQKGNPVGRQQLIVEDLRQLRKLGANCILLETSPWQAENGCSGGDGDSLEGRLGIFRQICDRLGFLVITAGSDKGGFEDTAIDARRAEQGQDSDIPVFRGIQQSFFLPGRQSPTPLYYFYRAKWSREPFVYLVPESLKQLSDANYRVMCYSNCSKVALYTDGRLFEFKTGERTFLFDEIPCKKPTVMLTAEGDGCIHSLSIHKSFTKSSPNDDIFPLE